MSQDSYQSMTGHAGAAGDKAEIIHIAGKDSVALPSADFVTNAEMTRDGQDLVLHGPDGHTVVIEGYFNASPAPLLQAPTGEALTGDLVNSFVQDSPEYASNNSMNDESPVGAVEEVSGHATVTHTDGSTETIHIGTAVFEGDVIETDESGSVNIQFIDQTSFAVSQNAKLAIDNYVFDPDAHNGTSDFSILRGLFVFTSGLIGRDDPDDVKIDTPMGSIGIRGTVIAGNADTGDITVMEGAIVLRTNNGSELTLSQQFETAHFNPADGSITYEGQMAPEQFTVNFAPIKDVTPSLFLGLPQNVNPTQIEPEAGPSTTQNGDAGTSATTPSAHTLSTDSTLQPTTSDTTNSDSLLTTDTVTYTDTTFGGTSSGFDSSASYDTQDSTVFTTTTSDPLLVSTTDPVSDPLAPAPTASTTTSTTTTTANTTGTTLPPPPPPPGSGGGSNPVLLNNISGKDGFVLKGATGALSHFGSAVAAYGDANHDGLGNFLIADDLSMGGKVFRFNGASPDGNLNPGPNNTDMVSVAGVGDFNGDGIADFMTGTAYADTPTTDGGNLLIQGAATYVSAGVAAGDMLGASVAGIGDINGDGFTDVLAGAPGTDGSGTEEGAGYVLFGSTSSGPIDVSTLSAAQGFEISGSGYNAGEFGNIVSGAGDFNNDGYADFMASEFTSANAGDAFLFLGGTSASYANPTGAAYHFTGLGSDGADIPVMQMGDINGDGISDIALVDTLADQMHVLFGGGSVDTNLANGVNSNGFTIYNSSATSTIDGGGYAGDFNGDGFDDTVVVVRDGTVADVFVVYGKGTLSGMIDVQSLYGNTADAFHITYDIGNTGSFDFNIATAGDVNGDGFGDILIGTPDANNGDGAVEVLFGRNDSKLGADGNMTHIAYDTSPDNKVFANGSDQHLVGDQSNNELNDMLVGTQTFGNANISMSGGAGNDILILNNLSLGTDIRDASNLGNLDGGAGIDALRFYGDNDTLDFASVGSEGVSGIEEIDMMGTGQTLTLGIDDIFRLLQQSDNGTLKIAAGGDTTNMLQIDSNGGNMTAGTLTSATTLTSALDAVHDPANTGSVTHSTGGGFDTFTMGGYQLQIESVLLDGTNQSQVV